MPDDGKPWRLESTTPGAVDGLALVPCLRAAEALGSGEVRVAVRAAALPDLDVPAGPLGGEIAGVVVEIGPGVKDLEAGGPGHGPGTGRRRPAHRGRGRPARALPAGWSFAEAAGHAPAADVPPVRAWDVRRAPEAFRAAEDGHPAGRIVLTIPPDPAAPRRPGTVLITGGTGTLGAVVARHLAGTRRAGTLMLTSRSGPLAEGAAALAADLAGRDVEVRIVSCDAADGAALAGLLSGIPGSTADRRPPRGRRARRRCRGLADPGPDRRGHAAQGGRGLEPAPSHPRPGPRRVRAVLLGRRDPRRARPGQLRRREQLPRRAGTPPARLGLPASR